MKYIFSGNSDSIGLEIRSDPGEVEKIICYVWPKTVFYQMTGILIPDYVELLSLEPSRDIFAVKYEDDIVAAIFEKIEDAPQFMQDLWSKRDVIRKHLKAALMEHRDEGYFYSYDEGQDKVIKTEDPNRLHNQAARDLSRTKIGCRVIVDLVDLLIAKGIITLAELPDYYETGEGNIKSIVDAIDWSKM
jgi:hypothetical protein